ncbi:prolipoprotein diacylglyceryl transferase [Pseudonocardia sp. KRD291]|uniref:prolipoprotein diacylglyceryl transferase n=1 Tax=Pseudonocardia sp. KRD291 TaxID=2792007 RepID=UPI001C4A5656|nr:prolipoprotein diacylglyceryl transferase family protein [Pseudonocardia sp. KRD291]
MTIRFDGVRRTDGPTTPPERFSVHETVAKVVPDSGRITLTRRVENVLAGTWDVTAIVEDPAAGPGRPSPAPAASTGSTGFAPVLRARAPGARIGAWPALVGLGAVVALVLQAVLAARATLSVPAALLLSVAACLVGLVGARLYYIAEHPNRRRGWMSASAGLCIQGFVLAALGTMLVGAAVLGFPAGTLLDVTAPGLLFGMAIGRVGCLFGGCCAGRPTASRWGLWSSDRRLGVRRVPTQLFESATAGVIGVGALLSVVLVAPTPHGAVFVGALATYTFGRQMLFPLRNLPRNTRYGRQLTAVVCLAVAMVSVLVIAA